MASNNLTTTLTSSKSTFYDKVFLERAELELKHDYFAKKKRIPANSGKTVNFTRYTPLAAITSATTEGSNPTAVALTDTTVSATLAVYSSYTKTSKLYSLTSIDKGLKEQVAVFGQNAGESMDTLVREELASGGTDMLPGSVAAITDIASSDTFDIALVRKAVVTLKGNKARKFKSGNFGCIINHYSAYDLMGDTTTGGWIDANKYATPEAIKRGVIGKMLGVEFVETNNGKLEEDAGSGTVDAVHSFFVGDGSYASVDIAGGGKKVYVKKPGSQSTDNPVDSFLTIGWKVIFAPKVLNADWVLDTVTAGSLTD